MSTFQPTPESIPPPNVVYRLRTPVEKLAVNFTPLNPISFLLRTAQIYPNKVAIVHKDVKHPVTYTYAVWAQRVQNLAYALIEAGIQPGDRVAVVTPNCPLNIDAYNGILAARAVITPINIRLTKAEIQYILEHSGTKLILVDHEYTHLVEGTKIRCILSLDTGRKGDPYEDFLASGRRFSKERSWQGLDMELDEDAMASLCYTSGTTGRPKGVSSTFRGSYLGAIANVLESGMNINSVYLWILPMFHAGGWTYPWSNVLAYTTQVTIRSVNYDLIWDHLFNSGITHYCAAPTVQIGIVNSPKARPLPRPVTTCIAGSAPTSHIIGELEKLGITPVHCYGLTETYGPSTRSYAQSEWASLPLAERSKLMARQGHSFATADDLRVIVRQPDGSFKDVPDDGVTLGEVAMRGNIVMKEYFRDPEATAKAFAGGYFASGDIAVRYPDQSISIQDRSKDIIISGGENASSIAIEQEIAAHAHILEAAVVAQPHPTWGERPAAFIILNKSGQEEWDGDEKGFETHLKKYLRGKLPGFAIPEWVYLVKDLPKTGTGKVQKNRLRMMVDKSKSKL